MAASNQPVAIRRHRTERRPLPPFGDGRDPSALSSLLDGALDACRFAAFPDLALGADSDYILDSEDPYRAIAPQFELVVPGLADLTRHLDLRPEDLSVAVSVRGRHLRRYDVLGHWPVDALPAVPWRPPASRLAPVQTGRRLDFVISLRVVGHREQLRRIGIGVGTVLCRREFAIKEPPASESFPMEWVDFEGSEHPVETLWVIEWREDIPERYDCRVEEALRVLVNRRVEQPLLNMNRVAGVNSLGWKLMAADITTQIWADVLENVEDEPGESDHESLAGQVFSRLAAASGMSYAELPDLIHGDDRRADKLSELRGLVAKLFNVVP